MVEQPDDAQAREALDKAKPEKGQLLAWRPNKGHSWNPLKGWPRNEPCFCNSGKKAKVCCLPKQPPAIAESDAAALLKAMNLGEPGKQAIRNEYQRHRDEFRKGVVAKAQEDLKRRETQMCECGHAFGLHSRLDVSTLPQDYRGPFWVCGPAGPAACLCGNFRPLPPPNPEPQGAPAPEQVDAQDADDPGDVEEP